MPERKSPPPKPPRKPAAPNGSRTLRTGDVPATQGMLMTVRDELKADMRSGFRAVDARLASIDARFVSIDARFDAIDAQFKHVDSRFSQFEVKLDAKLDSKFEDLSSQIARVAYLVEEQNSRNAVVLEGLSTLFQRQERVEIRVQDVEETVRSIARGRS